LKFTHHTRYTIDGTRGLFESGVVSVAINAVQIRYVSLYRTKVLLI